MRNRLAITLLFVSLVLPVNYASAGGTEPSFDELNSKRIQLLKREDRLQTEKERLERERQRIVEAVTAMEDRLAFIDMRLSKVYRGLRCTNNKIKGTEVAMNHLSKCD